MEESLKGDQRRVRVFVNEMSGQHQDLVSNKKLEKILKQ